MTKGQAAALVALLSAAFPDDKWGESTCVVYENELAHLDFELANVAIHRMIRMRKFRPTVSEIFETAADVATGERRVGAEAWGDVVKAIRKFGSYAAPEFSDPLVGETVNRMGWRNLCLGDASEASDRARFAEIYDSLSAAERRSLIAEPERINDAAGGLLGGGTVRMLRGDK